MLKLLKLDYLNLYIFTISKRHNIQNLLSQPIYCVAAGNAVTIIQKKKINNNNLGYFYDYPRRSF